MTIHRPLWMQPKTGDTAFQYDGLTLRWGLTGTWASEGVTDSGFRITQRAAGADFSVDISGGIAVVTGNDVSSQGTYLIASDATENVTIPAPPATGTDVWDIVLHVRDALYDGTLPDDTYDAAFEVLADSGGTPVGMPPTAILLGRVTVVAGQTAVTDGDIANLQISALTAPSWLKQVASSTDRPPLPLEGERIWRTDLKCVEVYDGSAWRVLGPSPAPTQVESTVTISGFTGTSYAAGSTVCGGTFTAPSTGRVYVTVSGRLSSASNGEQAFLSYEIRTGTSIGAGTVAQATSDNRALITSRAVNTGAASYLAASRRVLVTGLTGGADYNIRTMHKVTGGSGGVEYRALLIEPA